MKAVVIGAGGGGLAVLNAMLKAGFDVEVLERSRQIGGIWSSTRYPNLMIHSKSFNYRYVDFAPLKGNGERATREEILDYMDRFTARRGGYRCIRFNTEVERIVYRDDASGRKCEVIARDRTTGETTTIDCDVAVCALGFSNGGKPHLPSFQGKSDFKAVIVHSSEFTQEMLDDILINKKKVVVYGAGKSSHEVLSLFENRPDIDVRWIYKKSLWAICYERMYDPHRIWFMSKYGYYLFLCALRRKIGAYNWLLYLLERPLIWGGTFLNPLEPASNIFQNRMAIMRLTQYAYLRSVPSIKSEIVSLADHRITLSNDRTLAADYLICATGYERASNLPRVIVVRDGESSEHDFISRHSLYLEMVDPALPAVSLFTANPTFSQQLFGFSVAAEWLVRFYSGTLNNGPSRESMEEAQLRKKSRSAWCSSEYMSKGAPYYFDKDNFVLSKVLHELGIEKRTAWKLLMSSTDEKRFNEVCDKINRTLEKSIHKAGPHSS